MESWSFESSVWSPDPITPVFQYSLTPTFGSGYAGVGKYLPKVENNLIAKCNILPNLKFRKMNL